MDQRRAVQEELRILIPRARAFCVLLMGGANASLADELAYAAVEVTVNRALLKELRAQDVRIELFSNIIAMYRVMMLCASGSDQDAPHSHATILAQLKPEERQTVLLRDVSGFTPVDTARIVGIDIHVMANVLARGRRLAGNPAELHTNL